MKQVQYDVKAFIQHDCRVLSKNGDDVLVLLDDGQHLIVNVAAKSIHTALARDSGKQSDDQRQSVCARVIDFDGTGFIKNTKMDSVTVKTSLYDDKIKRLNRIQTILGLPSQIGWQEVDRHGDLSLVHYDDNADMNAVGHLRGVCMDVHHGVVIASSYGYTPTVKANQLNVVNNHVVLSNVDEQFVFPQNEVVMKRAYEGVMMRVIFHQGEILRLTHRRIRPLKSRWGDSPYFTKMYKDAGGPTDEQLFNLNKLYSPWCYVFIVVHPKLLIATREHVQQPYVVLLDIRKMYEKDTCPFAMNDVEWDLVHQLDARVTTPEELTFDEANKHLQLGYYPPLPVMDKRLSAGEAIILYHKVDGCVQSIVKVNSEGYDYRFKLRGNDSNLYHRFFELVPTSYMTVCDIVTQQEFLSHMVLFQPYAIQQVESMLDQGVLLFLPEQIQSRVHTRDDLLLQVWLNYVVALPLSAQRESLSFLPRFLQERQNVVNWLMQYHLHHIELDVNEISKHGVSIISAARNKAKSLFIQRKIKNEQYGVEHAIGTMIHNDCGSLYNLIKHQKEYYKQ